MQSNVKLTLLCLCTSAINLVFCYQSGLKAADVYKEVLKHGIENDVIMGHDTSVIDVKVCMARDNAPKIVAMESVLLKVCACFF